MKRIVKAGLLLVLMAFLHNLINVTNLHSYWSESGAAKEEAIIDTNFGDWEYFYHEPFTDRSPSWFEQFTVIKYQDFENVKFETDGWLLGTNHNQSIDGKSILLRPSVIGESEQKYFQMELPRGLGGFSFEYMNRGNVGDKLFIQVYGENTLAEPIEKEIIFNDTNVVHNIRYDFNVPSSNETVTVIIRTQSGGRVVIDNLKWSDHNIKVEFRDGMGTNDILQTEYIRYGRTALKYVEELKDLKRGYKLIGWYTNSDMDEKDEFDFTSPIRENTTLFSKWQIIHYNIEYDLNDGYFEPFETRNEMIDAFLTDFYNYLKDNDLLTGTDFHQWLMDEGFANTDGEIPLSDFMHGVGKTEGYDGLFTKGFVPNVPEVGDDFIISFDLNGGIFENDGATNYTNRNTMITDFLTDFWTFLGKPGTLSDFMHGKNKTSGFDGVYNQAKYFNKLYEVNNRALDPTTNKFVNQLEYNKWVLLIDVMDEYSKFNPEQSFWNSTFIGGIRLKPFIQRRNLWNHIDDNDVWAVTDKIPKGLKRGGTPKTIPTTYDGTEKITLPTPTRYDGKTFNGWHEYNYKTKTFVGPVTEITKGTLGNKDFYAKWDNSLPKAKPETPLGLKLRTDSYFNQLYEMSDLYTDETETEYNRDFSDLKDIIKIDSSKPFFINQPEYNKWHHLLDLIHDYTTFGNKAQWFGIWKSYYTGAIRMDMFFEQYNPWKSQESEERFVIFEMVRRIPHQIPKQQIPYSYTVEDETIIIPQPIKEYVDEQADYAGWYEYDFTNNVYFEDVVDRIETNSIGDKKFQARYVDKKYYIEYELNGGIFAPYTNRNEMINDFLDDFYDFIKEKLNSEFKMSKNEFKHGTGKTSGFKGKYSDYIYYSNKAELIPVQLLFATNNNKVDPRTNKFINQEEHNNRWLPLLEMAARFTKAVNSEDDFWNSPKLASERLKQLFSRTRPAFAPASVDDFFSEIPEDISKVKVPKFYINDKVTPLPEAVQPGKRFVGWYNDSEFTNSRWESIPVDTKENLTLYAKWYLDGQYEVTYDFGKYGYHSITRSEYFGHFINDYISEFNLNKDSDELYNDFFNNSKIQEGENLKDFEEIFTYKNRWEFLDEYILDLSLKENYSYHNELEDYEQKIWRLNIDAFFNQTKTSYIITDEEGEETTINSIDFSSLENANGFWVDTPYNKHLEGLVPGGELLPEEFINTWHPGFVFDGWFDNQAFNGVKLEKLPSNPSSDITLYAKWKDVFNGDITVIFLDHDDNVITSIEVPENGFIEEVNIPKVARDHYEFLGWYDGFTKIDFKTDKITESLIVKAKYKELDYTLEFETFGGTVIDSQQLTYPNEPIKPTDPVRDGFTFGGWYKDMNYENEFFFDFPLYDNTTVYAKWEPIEYNITYHLDGGEFVSNNGTHPKTYTSLDIITLSKVKKDNYKFTGWYLNAEFTGEVITVIEDMYGDLNLYAKFELNKFIVTFDNNNGDELVLVEVSSGELVDRPTSNPTKDGFEFEGWYLEGSRFDFNTPIKEDITLIADYKTSQYEVVYKYSLNEIISQQTINHGDYAVIPEVPNKLDNEGNELTGYYKEWDIDLTNIKIFKNYDISPVYTPINYNITYHLDGGTNGNNPKRYNYEDVIILEDATKRGYEFKGWYTDSSYTNSITIIESMTGNLNLYAKFEIETYNITYNLDGGTNGNNPDTFNINHVILLEDASKEGYYFRGWYLNAEFTGEPIKVIEDKAEHLTLYADFSDLIDYKINYILYPNTIDPNDPVVFEPVTIKYNSNQEVKLDVPNDRDSSEFMGWYDNELFEGSPISIISLGSTGDKTFYAKWELKEYEIELYNSLDDLINNNLNISYTVKHSNTISLNDYEGVIDEGDEFIGWHYLNENVGILFDEEQQINRSYKLYPKFGLKQYQVTFVVDQDTSYQYFVYHGNLLPSMPPNPTKTDDTFTGWYKEDGITAFNINEPITSDLTFIANFEIYNMYRVTFIDYNGDVYLVIPVLNETITKPTDPVREGYNFVGWFLNGSEFDFTTVINSNITLYANYSLNEYTITFNSNGGSFVEPLTSPYGTTINAPEKPTKDGNLFIDWYTDESLTIPYTFTTMPANNITLYAKWSQNEYQVRFFDYNNNLLDILTVNHGEDITNPPIVANREHYTHTGWDQSLTNITKDTDINAVYEGIEYTITFNNYDGTYNSSQTVIYPNRAIKPVDPTRVGYNFDGWFLNGSLFNFNSLITEDITLIAKWTSSEVTVTFDADGGTPVPNIQKIVKGTKALKPVDEPIKDGFVFDGWYLNDVKFDFNDLIYDDVILIAKYKEIFTVNYLDELDNVFQSFEVEKGETISGTIPDVPNKVGYDGVWDQNLVNRVINNDIDVRPVYTEIEYTITYSNLLSGVINSNRTKYKITDKTFILSDPTNVASGNEFSGWYLNDVKITEIEKGTSGNLVIEARWSLTTYSINYELNGGEFMGFSNRDEMIIKFLTEFHDFLSPSGVSLNVFMHGAGKTSGFDGIYNDYIEDLREINDKSINPTTGKFVNQAEYNKWVPLIDLMDEYTGINPDQAGQFWSSNWTAKYRFKSFIKQENVWPNDNVQLEVDEIVNRIPEEYRNNIVYNYDLNTGEIILPTPRKDNYQFLGWYEETDFSGSKVTKLLAGTTGNKTFYAKWDIGKYTINYNLEGGSFTTHNTKEDMIYAFLQDLYDFVGATESLNEFMHGEGKTSGFDGKWYSKDAYKDKIYTAGRPTKVNEAYFASSSKYKDKWLPFFDMMDEFVKINPEQSFWGSTWTGLIRLRQYLIDDIPGPDWSSSDLKMMPNPKISVTAPTSYEDGSRDIILPIPTRSNYSFEGWYSNRDYSGSKVTKITAGSTEDKTFYAKWEILISSGNITKKLLTQSGCYQKNIQDSSFPRTTTTGVIIHSVGYSGATANSLYNSWNTSNAGIALHALVDDENIYQYLEWNHRAYHTANKGNIEYVGIMIVENSGYSYSGNTIINYDVSEQETYFNPAWENAVNLTVYLLNFYGIKEVSETTVVGRHEAYGLNIALNDVVSPGVLFEQHSKTMADFRAEVEAKLQ